MSKGSVFSRTPLRISFFGGGTDYPNWYEANGGQVISTSIDKYCLINCRYLPPFFEHKHRITYSKVEHVSHIDDIQHPSAKACIQHSQIQDGLEIHYDGDLPARTGLGSSSAFTVGLVHALNGLKGEASSKESLTKTAIHIEQELIGEAVGSQDQCSAAYGGFNHIQFHTNKEISVTPIQFSQNRKNDLQSHLLLFYSGISRFATEIAEDQIKQTEKNESQLIKMSQLVDDAKAILEGNSPIEDFGELLHHTWCLKKTLSQKISNPTIDAMVDTARNAGAIGQKLLGAGGGGFLLVFAKPQDHNGIINALKNYIHIDFNFEDRGSHLLKITPYD